MPVRCKIGDIMIKQIQLAIQAENENSLLHHNWGYALYGMLVEQLSEACAEWLHESNFNPISQHLTVFERGKRGIWTINLLGEQAITEILPVLLAKKDWHSDFHQTDLHVTNLVESRTMTETQFCQEFLTSADVSRRIRVAFKTPCSFKSQEQYQLFPNTEWLIKSLLRKWHGFAQEVLLEDKEAQQQLIEHIHITQYQLKSIQYPLKSVKIPAFIGWITINISGPDALARLIHLLFGFAVYSGIGIKTALGMGGCQIQDLRKVSQNKSLKVE